VGDRVFAVAWLVVSAGLAWMAWQIEVTFSYEPIGPRAFPLLLCALMAASACWLLFRPDPGSGWPRGALGIKVAVMFAALLAYALTFEWLGFVAATVLMVVALGRLFGGRWIPGIVTGVVMGTALYYFFDRLLEVTLPAGRLFAGA